MGYDKIAWCYDLLSYMIFGNSIIKAQKDMLHFIPANCSILIAGGGTGWIIEEIIKVHSAGLYVTYVEASQKMVDKSQKRNKGLNEIEFICKGLEDINMESCKYDVIITPFFFDNFPQAKCSVIFHRLHASLKNDGLWLFTDFSAGGEQKFWQKMLLNFMYFFFKVACRIEASRLPEIDGYFLQQGYSKIAGKTYYKNFITATVYKKRP